MPVTGGATDRIRQPNVTVKGLMSTVLCRSGGQTTLLGPELNGHT